MAYISCDRQGSPEEQNQHDRDTGKCGLPRWPVVKSLPANAGGGRDASLIPGLWRSSGGGNGNPLWYSCLENTMNRGAWWAPGHGVAKSWTQLKWLSMHTYTSLTCLEMKSPIPGAKAQDKNPRRPCSVLLDLPHKVTSRTIFSIKVVWELVPGDW